MGWDVLFLLHLLCAMAAMAGVHSQGNASTVAHYRAFEGEAVHSMMRSWLKAGTNPDLFDSSHWGWDLDEHPCYENLTRANPWDYWYGINCSTMSYQPEGNLYYSLVQLNLYVYSYDSMLLIGELPPAITNLTNLEYLWIENARRLSGPLPAGLFCFSKDLQYMYVSLEGETT